MTRGHWTKGKHRAECDASEFVANLLQSHSARKIARLGKCSDRFIRRIAIGEQWCRVSLLEEIVDQLLPLGESKLPIYLPDIAIDGNTRVGGVGQYTLDAARGIPMRKEDFNEDSELAGGAGS